MPNPTRRRVRSREQWSAFLTEQAASGLSQKAYCEQHGISLSALYNAKSRSAHKALVAHPPPAFIDVSIDEANAGCPSPTWDVALSLGDGVTLRLRRSLSAQ